MSDKQVPLGGQPVDEDNTTLDDLNKAIDIANIDVKASCDKIVAVIKSELSKVEGQLTPHKEARSMFNFLINHIEFHVK